MYSVCGKCKEPKTENSSSICWKCVYAARKNTEKRAQEVLGSKCLRCGIIHPLVWDHIQDDGHKYKKTKTGSGNYSRQAMWSEFTKIVKTGSSDILQLLCSNCNQLKAVDRETYDQPPTYGMLNG